jgi:hypothetical protein
LLFALLLPFLFLIILLFDLFNFFGHLLLFQTRCFALSIDDGRAEVAIQEMCGAYVEEILSTA